MIKKIAPQTFIGRPFLDSMMNAQRSFRESNQKMEHDQVFQQFLKDNQLENKRTVMIVSGPDRFMYWYGVEANVAQVPHGLMKFALPQAQIAEEDENNQSTVFFDLPLTAIVPRFLKKVVASGVKVYQNLGDSDTPYIVFDLNLDTKKLTQVLYLKVSQ